MTTATQRNNAPAAKPVVQQQQTPAKAPDPHVTAGKPALESALDRMTEYTPFQAKQSIKLSAAIVLEHFCTPTKKGHRCTVSQAIRFIMLCRSRALNPWEGDAYIVGYDSDNGPVFSLITAHLAYLKRADARPEFDGMESGVVVNRKDEIVEYEGDMVIPGDVLIGAWARVHVKGRKVATYRRALLANVRKPYGLWKDQAAMMCVKTAESDALRSAFPNTYGGMRLEQVMDSDMMVEAAAEVAAAAPGRGPDAHPEPPPFDRAGCIRSISQQNSEAIKAGLLRVDAFPAMLAEYEAVKIDELTDEQLQQVEQQVAAVFRTTEPANGQMFPDGAGDPSEAMREKR